MDEQQFLTTKDILGYAEEYVIDEDTQEIKKYSLSNSLDNIKTAIYARTGLSINLKNAYWRIYSELIENIKQLMRKHHVIYSMTTWYEQEEKMNYIAVIMHVRNKWFITRYNEKHGIIYNYDKWLIAKKTIKYLFNTQDVDINEFLNELSKDE